MAEGWSDIDPDEPYSMNRKELGHALIVNNVATEFPGSMKDVEALQEAYQQVGFTVRVETDCNGDKMDKIKSEMIKDGLHKNSNCFMLTVITHGNAEGWLREAKEQKKRLRRGWHTESIINELSDVSTLVGKPKILVLDACRGGQESPGQLVAGGVKSSLPGGPRIVADKADFFIAFSTVPEYVAYAGDDDGSIYLQCFATFLQEQYMRQPLDRIYLMVKQTMNRTKQGGQEMVQCSEERNSLTRVLHFGQFHGAVTSPKFREEKIKKETEYRVRREMEQRMKRQMERQKKEAAKKVSQMEEEMKRMKIAEAAAVKKLEEERMKKKETATVLPDRQRKITNASQLKCTVTQTISAGFFMWYTPHMCLSRDDTLLVARDDRFIK